MHGIKVPQGAQDDEDKCQQTFSKSSTGRDERPKENLDTTHTIMKGKGKYTDVYIKPNCLTDILYKPKLFKGKRGPQKNKWGIQTSAVYET